MPDISIGLYPVALLAGVLLLLILLPGPPETLNRITRKELGIEQWPRVTKIVVGILSAVFIIIGLLGSATDLASAAIALLRTPLPPTATAHVVASTATPLTPSEAPTKPLEDETVQPPPLPPPAPAPPPNMGRVLAAAYPIGSDQVAGDHPSFPQHSVTLEEFYIHTHEVTNSEYQQCVADKRCTEPTPTRSRDYPQYYNNPTFSSYPVINVTWEQAAAYCSFIGAYLPTEDQWEAAGRGASGRTYPWGNNKPAPGYANLAFEGTTRDVAEVASHSRDKSPAGIYDLSGNVSEWTATWGSSFERNTEPFNYADYLRIVKGANYSDDATLAYPALWFRRFFAPEDKGHDLGFRCAWDTRFAPDTGSPDAD